MKSKILAICCIFAWCILLAFGFQVSSSQARNQEPNSLAQIPTGQTQPTEVSDQKLKEIDADKPPSSTKPPLPVAVGKVQAGKCPGSTRPEKITTDLAQPPQDACPSQGESQSDVDTFSWNSFIALNWPANPGKCEPDMEKLITEKNSGPVVWETFSEDTDVFVDTGEKPADWCSQSNKPKKLSQIAKTSHRVIENLKLSGLGSNGYEIAQAVGGVLIDQDKRFVRYEKRLNFDEYQYIVTNNLWNQQGQQGKKIEFPSGSIESGKTGAIEAKAAWKVLNPEEIKGESFYTTNAIVYGTAPEQMPKEVTVGLVGLHIIHKTKSQPTWLWSTFEHLDNAPTIDTDEMKRLYSFYNPQCSGQYCEPNKQTVPSDIMPEEGMIPPIQVVRTTPINESASDANKYYQKLLKGSVWANYQLVSTQWKTGFGTDPKPEYLANTTMETFIQKDAPLVTSGQSKQSSCIACHQRALTRDRTFADFSFLLQEAKPAK